MRALFCIFPLVLFISSCNNKSTYRGYIYSDSRKPLVNVKIIEESTTNKTYTDDKGYFQLKREGKNGINNIVIQRNINLENSIKKSDTISLMYSGGIQKFKYIFLENRNDTIYLK